MRAKTTSPSKYDMLGREIREGHKRAPTVANHWKEGGGRGMVGS